MHLNLLQTNILFTLAYYDALEYPLTTFELWRHLLDRNQSRRPAVFLELAKGLEDLRVKNKIFCEEGFWRLKERKRDFIRDRIKKQKISVKKLKKIKKLLKYFDMIPYVRAIFATGTLALKRSKNKSDWDILAVLKKDRIWIGRFFLTLAVHFLKKRRFGKKIKDRFCLNHFLTETSLILEEHSFYSASETSFAVPLMGDNYYQKFQQLNQVWVNSFQPNYKGDIVAENYFSYSNGRFIPRTILETIIEKIFAGRILNKALRQIMILKIKKNKKTYFEKADIRYNDQAMVFLPCPQRDKILEEANLKLTKVFK